MRNIYEITEDEVGNNYYDKAENDYDSLEFIIKRIASEDFVVSNNFCSNCQNAVEKYLKHILDKRKDTLRLISSSDFNEYHDVMSSHNLYEILLYMNSHIPSFDIDSDKVLMADEFYEFSRYPSRLSYNVTLNEMKQAWEALKYIKEFVDDYCNYK